MTESEKKKFYHSGAWERKRAQILKRDHYECVACRERVRTAKRDGIVLKGSDRNIRRAETVHHVVHLEDDPGKRLDSENLVSVCKVCHNRLHPEKQTKFSQEKRKKKFYITPERW